MSQNVPKATNVFSPNLLGERTYHPSDGMCALRGVLQTALPTKAVGKRGKYLSTSEQKTLLPLCATSEKDTHKKCGYPDLRFLRVPTRKVVRR